MLQGVFRGESPLTMRYDPPVIIVTPLGLLGNDTICHYKEGNKRRSAEVIADNVYFGDSKRENTDSYSGYGAAPAPAAGYSAPTAPAPVSDFSMIEDDDSQLPF